jgi:hypothetical protein
MNALYLLPVAIAALAGAASPPRLSPEPPVSAACQNAIRQVRESAGLPHLEPGVARPGEGLLIAAVDKRIDGCRVLTMARDNRDIRPEPAPDLGPARLIPGR